MPMGRDGQGDSIFIRHGGATPLIFGFTITARNRALIWMYWQARLQEGGRLLTARHRYEEYHVPVLPGCAAQSSMLP